MEREVSAFHVCKGYSLIGIKLHKFNILVLIVLLLQKGVLPDHRPLFWHFLVGLPTS